jgi:hypothetical protein
MSKPTRIAVISAFATLSLMVGMPAAASALTLYVAPAAPGMGTSCASPGYNHIQSAINAAPAGSTVKVCHGTYEEQLTIEKGLTIETAMGGAPTVKLPNPASNSTTACDAARNAVTGEKDQDLVSICTSETVRLVKLNFEAKWPEGTCLDNLYGILVAGGATLEATKVKINGAGAFPVNGCQGGIGIRVGFKFGGEVGHATLIHDSVVNYQKGGIVVDGPGSTATIVKVTATGAGEVGTAQNGIQISRGAVGTISKAKISNNQCSQALVPACGAEGEQAAGVLFYEAGAGSSITTSRVSSNDTGVYYVSGSPSEPASPEVGINEDKLTGNRYESVSLEQGNATVNADKIVGPGLIGIALYQREGAPYALTSSATGGVVKGMSKAAVEVFSDEEAGDIAGNFSITGGITKNATKVINNSLNFTVNGKSGNW